LKSRKDLNQKLKMSFNCFKCKKKKDTRFDRKHSQRLNSAFVIELNDDLLRETLVIFISLITHLIQ
jgi:hypothetical protein